MLGTHLLLSKFRSGPLLICRLMKALRGNPGYFHSAPLDFLLKHLLLYLATPSQKKNTDFRRIFNPEWDELYPSLDSTEWEELDSEEKVYEEEKETVREQNMRERKKQGRKAKFVRRPLPGARLCKLCVRSADRKVLTCLIYMNSLFNQVSRARRKRAGGCAGNK
jgi:hypothetical protein